MFRALCNLAWVVSARGLVHYEDPAGCIRGDASWGLCPLSHRDYSTSVNFEKKVGQPNWAGV